MASPVRPDTVRVLKKPRRLQLTDDERRMLIVALKNLRRRYGTWRAVADALDVRMHTVQQIVGGAGFGSMTIATKAAAVAGVTVERLLAPTVASATHCSTCGRPRIDEKDRAMDDD